MSLFAKHSFCIFLGLLHNTRRKKFVKQRKSDTRFHTRGGFETGTRQQRQRARARAQRSTAGGGPFIHSSFIPMRSPSARVDTDCIRRPARQMVSGFAGPRRGSGSTGPSQVERTANRGAIVRETKARSFVDVGKRREVSDRPPPSCDPSARTAAASTRWR